MNPKRRDVVDRLAAALHGRLQRFVESWDPSVVLDPAAIDEADRLWEAARPVDGNLQSLSVGILTDLAYLHLFRYEALPEVQGQDDLRKAVDFLSVLLDRAPERVPDQVRSLLAAAQLEPADEAERLTYEGVRAVGEYEQTGHSEALDVAVAAFRAAVAATPPGHPDLAARLSNLGASLYTRFERTGHDVDLDAAIDAGRQAVAATPPGHPDRAAYLSNLGASLRTRSERTGHDVDLDAAIDAGRQAVAATPPGHPNRAAYLSTLGGSLSTRSERTGDDTDLDAAINAERQAVAATPPGHPGRAKSLSNLGIALSRRFERTGDGADLDAAIDAGRQAMAATPPGHPDLAGMLSSLGAFLSTRFKWAGDGADLDAAIDVGRQAVAATPPGDPHRAMYLLNLGNSLHARFERAGDGADLDAAIDAGWQAMAATPPGDPGLAGRLSSLGFSLHARFERTGDDADLDAAIDVGRQAVAATPPGHPDRAAYLSTLGGSLSTRSERTGHDADLDAAIDAGRQAVAATPPGYPDLAGMLSNLGISLRHRFERTGDGADLDAAIDAGQQAVAATPPGNSDRPAMLSSLGNSLHARFEWAGDSADLDAAIDAGRQAVATASPGHPHRAMYLSNLGISLRARFDRTGDTADLDAAIDAGQQAVATTPPGHPEGARQLSNLGISLRARFDRTGDGADLDAAIDAGRQAVAATRSTNPNWAIYLTNLGNSLLLRFERAGDGADVDAAIDAGRQAIDATPFGHPNRAAYLYNLGSSLFARSERAGDGADLDAAVGCWQQASQMPTGTPRVRLAAARRWGAEAAGAGRAHEATEAYTLAVGLLPEIAWHGLGRATREEQLSQWGGLAADAAACAVMDARPELAVELLEQGRSVLWTQALNLRSDLADLADKAPDLAERLDRIRAILDSPIPEETAHPSESASGSGLVVGRTRQEQDAVELRRRKAREWDEVLAQVRAMDGFEHFLSAIPYAELAVAAAGGPVVIVNASHHGCHALIVKADTQRPLVVPLPRMSLGAAMDQAKEMLEIGASAGDPARTFRDREKDRHAVLDVLAWLWDAIAEPVLTALGRTGPPETGIPRPRVWWCPTGPLTVLPVHAAGRHPRLRTATTSGTNCVLDRVISSYIPTLTALTRASQPSAPAPVRQLTVGMCTTPGLPPLPAVSAELEVLARYFPPDGVNHQFAGPQATRTAVLNAIANHSWVHLACHASQKHSDPDRSGFALWDATLTITDLASLPSQQRDLAFLSACQTATSSLRYLDEAIHLAGAMQFLGYHHVIATMWTIADPPAPHIAHSFYATLTAGGSPDPGQGAEALHYAIDGLRQSDPTNPLFWAPYIHLGT